MSKLQKFIARLKSNPPPPDIKWEDLKNFLLHLGYKEFTKSGGSRRKFIHQDTKAVFICHQPHSPSCVDKGCVADLVVHLEENELI